MKKFLVLAAAVAAAYPATAGAATFKGVVVASSHGAVVVAAPSGVARTVRAHVRVGAVVSVAARQLANGTFVPSRVRVVGSARHARIRGVVVRRVARWTVVSAGRSLLAVRSGARVLAAAGDAQPGAVVDAGVQIANGSLSQTSMQTVGQTGNVTVQATITAVAPGSVTVSVGSQSISIPLPAGLQLPAALVGQTVQLQLSFNAGNVTASEDDDQGDDDQGDDDQGDDDGGDDGD